MSGQFCSGSNWLQPGPPVQPIRTFVPVIKQGKGANFCVSNIVRLKPSVIPVSFFVIPVPFVIPAPAPYLSNANGTGEASGLAARQAGIYSPVIAPCRAHPVPN